MESLEILNGKMSPRFDKNNDIYTVNVSSDISFLEIKYEISDNENINVFGNVNLQEGENKVILSLTKDDEINYYTLIVNKQKTKSVIYSEDYFTPLEMQAMKKPKPYQYCSIACFCFLLLLFIYFIFFRNVNKNK